MKNTYMRQAYLGTVGDIKTLETHFARMAEKGWMIDKIGAPVHRYRAVEPCKKQFFVDLLPQITVFDYPENEDAQDYRKLCEESGWTFVTASRQLHVFCAESSAPVIPIHTDNRIQAQIYLKTCRKYELVQYIPLLMLILPYCVTLSLNGIEVLFSNSFIFQMIGFSVLFIGYAWTAGFSLVWYRRTKKAAGRELPLPTVNYRLSRIRNKTFVACAVIYSVCLLAGFFLEILGGIIPAEFFLLMFVPSLLSVGVGLWFRRRINTKQRNRKANKRLFIVSVVIMEVILLSITVIAFRRIFSSLDISASPGDRPALALRDVGVSSAPDSESTLSFGSVAASSYTHWEVSRQGSVRTNVYRSINRALTRLLYDHYAKEFVERSYSATPVTYLTPDEAAFWGADEGMAVFYTDRNSAIMLLLKDKTILRLSFDGELINMEDVGQAVQKLWAEIN